MIEDGAAPPAPPAATVNPRPPPPAPETSSEAPDTARASEPFAGLYDADEEPEAERVRRQALEELAPLFQVVGPEVPPEDRLPNQITQEELEKVAANYSQVIRGVGNLTLATDHVHPDMSSAGELPPLLQEFFLQNAGNDIATILQTESGRALIDQLVHMPDDKKTTLRLAGGMEPHMAETHLISDGLSANLFYLPGARYEYGSSHPFTSNSPSHVVLMHELTHALRMLNGTASLEDVVTAEDGVPRDVGILDEEHAATGLGRFAEAPLSENAYRAERAAIGAGGVGALPGDAGMPQREAYLADPPPPDWGRSDPALFMSRVLARTGPAGEPPDPESFARVVESFDVDRDSVEVWARDIFGDDYVGRRPESPA